MKKLFIFILLSISIFAKWETIELVDEFQEKSGDVSAITSSGNEFLRIDKYKDTYWVTGLSAQYLGGKGSYDETSIMVKNDKGDLFKTKGNVSSSNGSKYYFYGKDAEKFVEFLKTSNSIKVVVTKYNDGIALSSFDTTEFDVVLPLIKSAEK